CLGKESQDIFAHTGEIWPSGCRYNEVESRTCLVAKGTVHEDVETAGAAKQAWTLSGGNGARYGPVDHGLGRSKRCTTGRARCQPHPPLLHHLPAKRTPRPLLLAGLHAGSFLPADGTGLSRGLGRAAEGERGRPQGIPPCHRCREKAEPAHAPAVADRTRHGC